jgi:GT2 family glycosyltransferase/SAM-dependent methyltransferase
MEAVNIPSDYIFHADDGIWERPSTHSIAFSDGDSQEEFLREIFSSSEDRSTSSETLRGAIRDWSSEYHLSPLRYNLLRGFTLTKGSKVLEIGCGCGAITRYLGEQKLEVVALEGSRRRASITALRCRDLSGVKVVFDTFDNFETTERFDAVTLIGVLEYARLYSNHPDPIGSVLKRAASLLKPDGHLIIAIENRLGLKYWNGRPEDHLGTLYTGITDLYPPHGPVTFGKKELEELLHGADLPMVHFYYPFPDYKLPSLLFSDEALRHPHFRHADILTQALSRSYHDNQTVNFDEGLVWPILASNGLTAELANSFLVTASKSTSTLWAEGTLARCFSLHQGLSNATDTAFQIDGQKITVHKAPLFQLPEDIDVSLTHVRGISPYIHGELYIQGLRTILARGGSYQEVVEWARPWHDLLLRSRTQSSESLVSDQLPQDFIDCTPFNIIKAPSGELHYIDREWRYSAEIPLIWVLARGLALSFLRCPLKGFLRGAQLRQAVDTVLTSLTGRVMDGDSWDAIVSADQRFQSAIVGPGAAPTADVRNIFDSVLEDSFQTADRLHNEHAEFKLISQKLQEESRTLATELHRCQLRLALTNEELSSVYASRSWTVTTPLRAIGNKARKVKGRIVSHPWYMLASRLRYWLRPTGFRQRARKGIALLRGRISRSRTAHPVLSPRETRFESWLARNSWTTNRAISTEKMISSLESRPLLSIIMPVYNPPLAYFDIAIESIRRQKYENWELLLADDASTDLEVRKALTRWSETDARIKVSFLAENGGISVASNVAASMATGEFIVLIDNDDEIEPDALAEVARALNENPGADVIYSDDDKINTGTTRHAPQFKPGWSPELLLSYMYLGHLFCIRRALFNEVGGFRKEFDGSQDYDLALRVTEKARAVVHIPKILYHWRVLPNSTALSGLAKPKSIDAGRLAVEAALSRRGVIGEVYQPEWAHAAGCGIFGILFPDEGPKVTIIIPTKDKVRFLRECVSSICEKTTYRNYEILVIDNGSVESETIEYLRTAPVKTIRIESNAAGFNFASINNKAAEVADGEFILFLNNDTEVISPRWLSQMVGYLQLKGVGAVGARLIFPDNRIQHAGILHGLYDGLAGPAFKLLPATDNGYLSHARITRNYSAVTAACLLTRKSTFRNIGGFDATNFAVAYNDVDFCYRVRQGGQRVVYCSDAELYHKEGASRGYTDNPREIAEFRARYRSFQDPYFNTNLSRDNEWCEIDSRTLAASPHQQHIRTLVVAHNMNWEGAPLSQFELVSGLTARGVIKPLVYSPHDGPLRKEYERLGIPTVVSKHPLADLPSEAHYIEAIRNFSLQFASFAPEMVYANTCKTFFAIEAAKLMGVPSIWNIRESESWRTFFSEFPGTVAGSAIKCFEYPYKVVFVANSTREGCSELGTKNNLMTIHNGLNLTTFENKLARADRTSARTQLGVSDEEVVFLILGTVCDRKGQLDLIHALKRLSSDAASQCRILIVGDRPGPYSSRLHREVASLPAYQRNRVTIVSETGESGLYFKAADVFVCASRIESYPRVILEAMAAGLPIVSTPVFGISEQIRPGVNGLFYNPGDAQTLATLMEKLVLDPEERRRLASNSPWVLKTLSSYDEMVEKYAQVFGEAWLTGNTEVCAA